MLISGVINMANNDNVKSFSGKLSGHCAFKVPVNADGRVEGQQN